MRIYLNVPNISSWVPWDRLPQNLTARQIATGVLIFAMVAFLLFCLIELYFVSPVKQAPKTVIKSRHKPGPITKQNLGPDVHYGIVIDCGSSGSRVFVYFWPSHSGNPQDLLNIQQLMDKEGTPVIKKTTPGLDTFRDNPEASVDYISPLLTFAGQYIPLDRHKDTLLFILATAGMRMIPQESQKSIFDNLKTEIPKKFDYVVSDNNMEVISGKMEGVYAWIAVNYVLNKFSHGEEDHPLVAVEMPESNDQSLTMTHIRRRTVGVLDMGGGSMQIAFEVTSKTADIPRMRMAEFNLGCQNSDQQHTYRVYIHSFLGFGANEARERYDELLLSNNVNISTHHANHSIISSSHHDVISDPCLPPGLDYNIKDNQGYDHKVVGTGDYLLCREALIPLLNQSGPCEKPFCSMNGIHQPDIPFLKSDFYGFSEFWYTMQDVYRIGGTYRSDKFDYEAKTFCSTEWFKLLDQYERRLFPQADEKRFRTECFKSAWLSTVLHKGLHFPRSYKRLHSVQTINNREVQWTLGALLHRTRYLPLRDMKSFEATHFKPRWSAKTRVFNTEFMIVLCILVVFLAIILYTKRLKLCKSHSMSRVPSMSYFMVDADQVEQGVRTKGYIS